MKKLYALVQQMSKREKFGTAFILAVFFALLGLMLWLEQASYWQVITLLALCFLGVVGWLYLMLMLWEEDDFE